MRGGEKRSDFGRRVFGVLAPATGLADIDELDGGSLGLRLLCQIAKEFLFLGTCHHDIVMALNRLEIGTDITSAQRRMQWERLRQALTQRLRVEGLGLVAIANQCGHDWSCRNGCLNG